jgi:hypothetical protein
VNWLSWLRRPVTAWTLAGLTVLLTIALVPLSLATRQNLLAAGGANVAVGTSFAVVGLVVALHRPRNPIGWLMLFLGAGFVFYTDGGLYNVLNYRLGHRLPLAPVVLFLYHAESEPDFALVPLTIFLFPDGQLSSARWRRVVLLATRVLSVSSPVAVAASTLAAAALFTPVRRRVQRVVDRRFNRVRYDGDRTVEAFAARLKDAVDLDMVHADLAGVVSRTLEPTHVTIWTARNSRLS